MKQNSGNRRKPEWILKRSISIFLAALMIFSSLYIMPAKVVYGESETYLSLGTKAIQNSQTRFTGGTPAGNAYGNFTAYDGYVLKKAGVDLNSWLYGGKSLKEGLSLLAEDSLQMEGTAVSAKRIASEYLALSISSDSIALSEAQNLLNILVLRQKNHHSGGFDEGSYTEYSNLPAFDWIGRAGKISSLDVSRSVDYILSIRDNSTKAWPAGSPDFMSTTQAIRSLFYLKQASPVDKQAAIEAMIQDGVSWIKANQQIDGGFDPSGYDDNMMDVAEAILTFKLLSDNPDNIKKSGGKSLAAYMKELGLNANDMPSGALKGSFGESGNIADSTWALDAYKQLGAVSFATDSVVTVETLVNNKNINELGSHALTKNVAAFTSGTAVTDAYGGLGSIDGYVIAQAGFPLSSLSYNGKSYEASIIDLAKDAKNKETKSNTKRLTGEYLFLKAYGAAKASNALTAITSKQTPSGSFGNGNIYGIYEYMPAFDRMVDSGDLNKLNVDQSIRYILSQKDSIKNVWPADDPTNYISSDFMVTAQAIRALNGLKALTVDSTLKADATSAINNGIIWMKTYQQSDGSFCLPGDDPVIDSAEAIKTFNALGIDPLTIKKDGKSAGLYILQSGMNIDGTFGSSKNLLDNIAIIESCLILNGGNLTPPVITPGGGGTTTPTTPTVAPTPPAGTNITVHLSIIGKSKESLFDKNVVLSDSETYKKTAMGALAKSGISYMMSTSYPGFVTSIGGQENKGMSGWMYKVNGTAPAVLAKDYSVSDGSNIVWWYSTSKDDATTIGGGSSSGASGGATTTTTTTTPAPTSTPSGTVLPTQTPQTTPSKLSIPTANILTTGDKLLSDALNQAGTGGPLLKLDQQPNGLAEISLRNLQIISQGQPGIIFSNKGISLNLTSGVLTNISGNTEENNRLQMGINEVPTTENKAAQKGLQLNKNLKTLGIAPIELTAEIQTGDGKPVQKPESLKSFIEPVEVIFSLEGLDLTKNKVSHLTGIRYERSANGSLRPILLGGTYHPETNTFHFLTEHLSIYGIAEAKKLTQVEMKIGENAYQLNGKSEQIKGKDTPILIDGKAYLPVDTLVKVLGGKDSWKSKNKDLTLKLMNKTMSYTFDKKGTTKGMKAIKVKGKAYLLYTELQQVYNTRSLWIPSTKTVLLLN